ncbi:hypothetical protein [Arthrobacter sp. NPDC090010]|uniref:hypothetical protein n=1 Tax=Arthrobacter sp. NPDC090010 TaxID=3363942 RepID=UPI00382F5D0F
MSHGETPHSTDTSRPAHWVQDGEDFTLVVRATRRLDAFRPLVWISGLAAGLLAALLSAGGGASVAFGVGVFVLASVTFIQFYARLHAAARPVTLTFGAKELTVIDGAKPPLSHQLSAVSRILIAHDGAPARILIDATGARHRWTIGDLHRNNTIEAFVDSAPPALGRRLQENGLVGGVSIRRKIRFTEYRKATDSDVAHSS